MASPYFTAKKIEKLWSINQMDVTVSQFQKKIMHYVSEYRRVFSEEYEDVVEALAYKRKIQTTKFAEMPDDNSLIRRKLGEMPATLFAILQMQLNAEEKEYFSSKKGLRWFYRTYKEFRITEKI